MSSCLVSVITASDNEENVEKLKLSIGAEFFARNEFIQVSGNEYGSLAKAYNAGTSQAKGEICIYCHDDVEWIASPRWLDPLIERAKKPLCGLIGLAGSTVLPENAMWWSAPQDKCRGAVYHHSAVSSFAMALNTWPHRAAQFGRVAVCDGVFLLCERVKLDAVGGFDEETCPNCFHYYDVLLSLRMHLAGYQNYVAPFPILHRSGGNPNESYQVAAKQFTTKYGRHLPLQV